MIDTHAHIHVQAKEDQAGIIQRAKQAGVDKIINVACSLPEMADCLALADEYDFIYTTVGIHPTDLTDNVERDLERVFRYAKNEKKVVAIGEIGLDYYHDKFPHQVQQAFLVGQLNIAKQLGLPAILHCRAGKNPGENEAAFADLIALLEEQDFNNAVAHCFSGNAIEAEKLLDMGLLLGFTGVITYPNNEELRQIIKKTPLDRILIETDSPFLTPIPHRGKKNEPAYVAEVVKTITEVKSVSASDVDRMTSANAERFFGI